MKQLTEQMQQANLSEKEQAVMEKILSNISNTVFLSGAQLAEYCDVSAPYITRLVRKLGYTMKAGSPMSSKSRCCRTSGTSPRWKSCWT